MRLWVISDLHLDVAANTFHGPVPEADVAVVAGDIVEGIERSVGWLAACIRPHMPVVFVPGNHEFYTSCHAPELARGLAAAKREGIVLLDDASVDLAGVRFAGGTLWTDYALDGTDADAVDHAMVMARRALSDHTVIGWRDMFGERFRPEHARDLHRATRAYLETALAQAYAGPTVVVTHHAPHRRSIHARYAGHPINPAFASDLSALIEAAGPALWVHGHTHNSFDYQVGGTRVLCNPMGYGRENPAFDPGLVVKV